MTPEMLEKVIKDLKKQIRCLSCEIDTLTAVVNTYTTTTTSTTTTTTTP